MTILVMNVFKAAQPALLYLVPAIIAAAAIPAALEGKLMEVLLLLDTLCEDGRIF